MFGGILRGKGTSIDGMSPSGFLNELGPHFCSPRRFYSKREVEKSLDSSRTSIVRPNCTTKEFIPTEISRYHCLVFLITNGSRFARFYLRLLLFFFIRHLFRGPLVRRFYFSQGISILNTFFRVSFSCNKDDSIFWYLIYYKCIAILVKLSRSTSSLFVSRILIFLEYKT